MKRRSMAVAAAVLGLSATLMTAGPASAAAKSIPWTKTADSSPGGRAQFNANNNYFGVCDIGSDGWDVFARVYYLGHRYGEKQWLSPGIVQDTKNDKHCHSKKFGDIHNGMTVQFVVCLHKIKNGEEVIKYCRTSRNGKA